MYNRFVRAFNLPGFAVLGVEMANFLDAETCYRFTSVRRCTPGALLWQAIGCERASRMPGIFGNVFLTAGQVADALKQAEAGESMGSDSIDLISVIRKQIGFAPINRV